MAIKFLDLDSVHKPNGRIKISGEEYDVYPMTVKNLINLTTLQNERDSLDEDDDAAGMDNMVRSLDVLATIFPDCPREVLDNLSMEQIQALVAWSSTLGEEDVEKNSETPPEKAEKKTEKPK
jgi:hypothetical protein